jgi:hypothetical protein
MKSKIYYAQLLVVVFFTITSILNGMTPIVAVTVRIKNNADIVFDFGGEKPYPLLSLIVQPLVLNGESVAKVVEGDPIWHIFQTQTDSMMNSITYGDVPCGFSEIIESQKIENCRGYRVTVTGSGIGKLYFIKVTAPDGKIRVQEFKSIEDLEKKLREQAEGRQAEGARGLLLIFKNINHSRLKTTRQTLTLCALFNDIRYPFHILMKINNNPSSLFCFSPNAPAVQRGQLGSIKQEQGGWIVKNDNPWWKFWADNYSIERFPAGTRDSINPTVRPVNAVGVFHGHSNTRVEGYSPDPSQADISRTQNTARFRML